MLSAKHNTGKFIESRARVLMERHLMSIFETFRLTSIFAASLSVGFLTLQSTQAEGTIAVPPGNRSVTQPAIPKTSADRARAFNTTYDEKYEQIIALLTRETKLVTQIKEAAAAYRLDPIHIIGALVGEHTYNVSAIGKVQTYYVKALAYTNADFSFRYKGVPVQSFVKKPEFKECATLTGSAELWNCRDQVWDDHFRGKTVDNISYEPISFQRAFSSHFMAGKRLGWVR